MNLVKLSISPWFERNQDFTQSVSIEAMKCWGSQGCPCTSAHPGSCRIHSYSAGTSPRPHFTYWHMLLFCFWTAMWAGGVCTACALCSADKGVVHAVNSIRTIRMSKPNFSVERRKSSCSGSCVYMGCHVEDGAKAKGQWVPNCINLVAHHCY